MRKNLSCVEPFVGLQQQVLVANTANGIRIRYSFCGHVLHYLEDSSPMNHSEASNMQSLVSLVSLPGVRVENLSAVDLLSERKKFTHKSFFVVHT